MYLKQPVLIPSVQGITTQKRGESTYVSLAVERRYDPVRKFNHVKRVQIGVQLPNQPELMLPNENYLRYFTKEDETDPEKLELLETYTAEREHCQVIKEMFQSLAYEFAQFSKKDPNTVVSRVKVQMLNRILKELMEMMQEENYHEFLAMIPEPRVRKEAKGKRVLTGATNSDVALLLANYKAAVHRFFYANRM